MNGQHDEVLDSGLIADIPKFRELFEEKAQFHWQFYSELALLRSKIYDKLKSSLLERAAPFSGLVGWQRAVKYKYSLSPLSTKGSLADPGGRFNIGAIDPARFPFFPALYLASDKKTALAELLGRDGPQNSLTAEELALTKPTSITIVSVSGKLESVLDVRDAKNLAGFVNLIKGFQVSGKLLMKARKVGLKVKLVRNTSQLAKELASSRWREWPMGYDVPAASQIFGRIVLDAGIEGILYGSVLTSNPCLAIYPQNFENSSSFIELDDPCPPGLIHKRIDSMTFKNFL
jgi:hypothetical protein